MRYLASKYSIILAVACMILVWSAQAGVKQFRILDVQSVGPKKYRVTIDTEGLQGFGLGDSCDLMSDFGDGDVTISGKGIIKEIVDTKVVAEILVTGELVPTLKDTLKIDTSGLSSPSEEKPSPKAPAPQTPPEPQIDTKGNDLAVTDLEKAVSNHNWPGVEEKLLKAEALEGLTAIQNNRIRKGRKALKAYLSSRSIILGKNVAHTRDLSSLDRDLKKVLGNRVDSQRLEKLSKAKDLMAECGDLDGQRRIAAAIEQINQEEVLAGQLATIKSVISKDFSARDWSSLENHLKQVIRKFKESDLSASDIAFFKKIIGSYEAYLKGRSALLLHKKYKSVGEMGTLTADLEAARTKMDESRFLGSCKASAEQLSLAGDETAAGIIRKAARDFSIAKKHEFEQTCAAHFTTLRNAFDAKEYQQLNEGYQKPITEKCLDRFKEYESFFHRISNMLTASLSAEKLFKEAVNFQKIRKDYPGAIRIYERAAKVYSDIGDNRMRERAFRGISECRQELEKEETTVKARLMAIEKGVGSCDSSRCAKGHLTALEGLRKEAADIFDRNEDIRRVASRAENKARQVLKKYGLSEEIGSAIYEIKRRAAGCSTESCCRSLRRDLSRLVSSHESHVQQFPELKKKTADAEYEITARIREIQKEEARRAEQERERREAQAAKERERRAAEKKRAEEEAARKKPQQEAKKKRTQNRLRSIIP